MELCRQNNNEIDKELSFKKVSTFVAKNEQSIQVKNHKDAFLWDSE